MNANHPRRNVRSRRATAKTAVHPTAATSKSPTKRQPARAVNHDAEVDWADLLSEIQTQFSLLMANGVQLFQTNARGLFNAYLGGLPNSIQVHTCTACHRFVHDFGGLVAINELGQAYPAIWPPDTEVPKFYRNSVLAMRNIVSQARVTSVFLHPGVRWTYQTETEDWTHFGVVHHDIAFKHGILTAKQVMAAKREDFRTVSRALAEFNTNLLAEALRVLESAQLPSSEKFVNPVRWLHELHIKRDRARDLRLKENILWRAVASAPPGYCHPRAGVVGSLLEDLAAGLSFEKIKARFSEKVNPVQYQRPQAAPTAGNIAQAEKLVEQLGIRRSLERRFARLEECHTLWTPGQREKQPLSSVGGVFGHLQPKGPPGSHVVTVDLPAQTVTWVKFAATVLPYADAISCHIPASAPFIAMTAAVHADAPPILKWDRPDRRNTVGWYTYHIQTRTGYHSATPARQWRLTAGTWCPVTGICEPPSWWSDQPMRNLGSGAILLLKGAADITTNQGNGLFPEILREELHAVRATIEAYSRTAVIHGIDEASACGVGVPHQGQIQSLLLRVSLNGAVQDYHIDRWD